MKQSSSDLAPPALLSDLRALEAHPEVTPAPWHSFDKSDDSSHGGHSTGRGPWVWHMGGDDFELACALRNNLPALLDRLEAAEALIVEAAPYVSRCASNEECLDSYAARMSENEDVPKMEALASRMYAFGGEPPEEGSDGEG